MSHKLWTDLDQHHDRRPIVVATLARELRHELLQLISAMPASHDDIAVSEAASRVADLDPRIWERAERIRSFAQAAAELDDDASVAALELMAREVRRMLESLVRTARISTGQELAGDTANDDPSDSGTWLL